MPSLLGDDPRVIPNKRNTTVPTGQGLLDAAALLTTPVPVLGDIAGLLSDANMIRNEGATFGNVAMAGLGLLPFVPSAGSIRRANISKEPMFHASFGPLDGPPRTSGNGFFLASSENAAIRGAEAGNTFPMLGISRGTPSHVTQFRVSPKAKIFGVDPHIGGIDLPNKLDEFQYKEILNKIKQSNFSNDQRVNKKAREIALRVLNGSYEESGDGLSLILRDNIGEDLTSGFRDIDLKNNPKFAPDWEGFEHEGVFPEALRSLGYDGSFVSDEAGLSFVALSDQAINK